MQELPLELRKAKGTIPPEDRDQLFDTINACSPDTRANLRLYMEATSSQESAHIFFLITEDYKLFCTFIRSRRVEDILKKMATSILGIQRVVDVKLAGEVIPYLSVQVDVHYRYIEEYTIP